MCELWICVWESSQVSTCKINENVRQVISCDVVFSVYSSCFQGVAHVFCGSKLLTHVQTVSNLPRRCGQTTRMTSHAVLLMHSLWRKKSQLRKRQCQEKCKVINIDVLQKCTICDLDVNKRLSPTHCRQFTTQDSHSEIVWQLRRRQVDVNYSCFKDLFAWVEHAYISWETPHCWKYASMCKQHFTVVASRGGVWTTLYTVNLIQWFPTWGPALTKGHQIHLRGHEGINGIGMK